MHITLDQAHAFMALAAHGSFAAAGKALHKTHTAVMYAIRQLEEQSGLGLVLRGSSRARLSPAGEQVLALCHQLVEAEHKLIDGCGTLRSGWEPGLHIVFDAVFPVAPILDAVMAVRKSGAPTRVQISESSLASVETLFQTERAQLMISLLPASTEGLRAVRLRPLVAHLVARRSHPLAKRKGELSAAVLAEHLMVTVRGSDPRLHLPTAELERQSLVQLSDFHAKKAAIMQGLGFGWLPDWLIHNELKKRQLKPLRTTRAAQHRFEPVLYHRSSPGPAAQRMIDALRDRAE